LLVGWFSSCWFAGLLVWWFGRVADHVLVRDLLGDGSSHTLRLHMSIAKHAAGAALLLGACLSLAASALHAQAPHADPSAFEIPAWAFPVLGSATAPSATGNDTAVMATVPTSHAKFSVGRTRDRYDVADWNPATHRAAPPIVMHGRKPVVMACGFCHLADGRGRPENAMIAGLPADYFVQQVKDMRSRVRHTASPVPFPSSVAMQQIADSVTDAELAEAARYFARVRARRASRVVEADSVPRFMPLNGLSTILPGNEREALGERLVEVAVDLRRHELHDPMAEYVAYVPHGSLARGRALAAGDPRHGVKGCTSCHGADLRGVKLVPPIAGRSPSYLLRQLIAFRTGARDAATSAPMREVAARLSIADMVAAAAYAGSRAP
jgi:cytochrome c553